jgi:hypothetical protein
MQATAYKHAYGGMITFSKASEPAYLVRSASWQPPLRLQTLINPTLSLLPSSLGQRSALSLDQYCSCVISIVKEARTS